MKKLYFKDEETPERCYTKEHFLQEMKEQGIAEMKVIEAVRDKSKDYFWCAAVDDSVLTSDLPCGKDCPDYEPRNKKSGICKYKKSCYVPDGPEKTLKIKIPDQKSERELVECADCDLKHFKDERIAKKKGAWTTFRCPRCGSESYCRINK